VPLRYVGVHDTRLLRTSRSGPDAIILRLPLLQSHHRGLAKPATGAANAQEEREEINECDKPSNAFIQLFTPIIGFLSTESVTHAMTAAYIRARCCPSRQPVSSRHIAGCSWTELRASATGSAPSGRPPAPSSRRTFLLSRAERTCRRDATYVAFSARVCEVRWCHVYIAGGTAGQVAFQCRSIPVPS
jgi:hypothetical protein